MDYIATMQRVLEHIDAHLREDLSADSLAAFAGFSTYHFCRVFQWRVGHPVMDYVRRRRLAFAAAELNTGRRILDIALEYGFETHSGFSKAFRKHFGCPPETYRLHARVKPPTPPSLVLPNQYQIGGLVMEPKMLSRPTIRLAGYSLKTKTVDGQNNRDIPAFWQSYLSDGRMNKLHGESFVTVHDEYGACFTLNMETGEMEYLIGVPVAADAVIPEDYVVRELPATTYAVFATPPTDDASFSNAIQGLWQYAYAEWFPTSGYEYAPGCVDFELYTDENMKRKPSICEVWIPVVKKQ